MSSASGSNPQQTQVADLPTTPYLVDWVEAHAARAPEAPALASPTVRLSYGELAERVRQAAAWLTAAGVQAGSRVMLALPNTPGTVVASLATQSLGAMPLEVSREWGKEMLAETLRQGAVRHLFIDARDAAAWARATADLRLDHVWVLGTGPLPETAGDGFAGATISRLAPDGSMGSASRPVSSPPAVDLDPDQAALVLYTSGTLGRPSGVVQTYRNIDANTRAIVEYLRLGPSDRAMLTLPLYYCYGRSVLQTHLLVGGSVYFDHRMAFPRTVLETLADEGCTGFAGVPMTFEVIRRQVDVSTIAFRHLRYLTQAGGAMAPETIDWVRAAFSPAQLYVMYGQTEATARLTYLPPERADEKRGSIGIPVQGVEIRVVDAEAQELPPGVTGELIVRGPNVTPGYLDDPVASAAILRDGWLWTGDLVERDSDGFLFHRGRARDMLKVGGHRVGPTEVEHVLLQHPDIAEAAVVGQADALLGEVPVAVVVPRDGTSPSADEIRRFCRGRLAAHQVPVRIVFVPSLPRNAAGKPLRDEIARRYATPEGVGSAVQG